MNSKKRKQSSRGLTSDRGATVVEMTLVLPVLLLFIFCFLEISRYLEVSNRANAAALEGAHLAAIIPGLDSNDRKGRVSPGSPTG